MRSARSYTLPLLLALTTDAASQTEHCLHFGRGGTVRVEEATFPTDLGALTVECWMRATSKVRKPVDLVARWSDAKREADPGSFHLALTGGDRVGFWIRSQAGEVTKVSGAGGWDPGEWIHLAATWDGALLVLYVDGREVARQETPEFGPLLGSSRPLVLGPDPGGARRPPIFDGYLGGVVIWDKARSPEQLREGLEDDLSYDDFDVLASYSLRAAVPLARAEDLSGEGHHGLLTEDLARSGWARTIAWDEQARPASLDLFAYDLADVLGKGRDPGRRILVSHADEDRVGVLYQEPSTRSIGLVWIGPELGPPEVHVLANPTGARLAAGTTDPDGNVYYLVIGDAPRDRAEGVEVPATFHKASAQGEAKATAELDVLRSGLNVFSFDRGDRRAGNLRYSKGVLGLILPRTMHRSNDGLRHQGAIAVTFSAKDLSVLSRLGQTSGHSMANHLALNDKGAFLGLDLGDNYPRGVHLHEFTKANRTSRLVFTFKTAHATSPRNGSPVYDEISGDGQTFYRWSNDNGVYTELGGIVEGKKAYTIVFATDRSPEGRVLDNSRAFRGCDDPRDLALVRVVKSFGSAPSGSQVSDSIMADLPRKPLSETGGYYDFAGGWRDQRVVGVRWLTDYPSGAGAHAPQLIEREDGSMIVLWERSGDDASLRGMVLGADGEVQVEEFSLGSALHLNRQDRTVSIGGRIFLLAGEVRDGANRLYYIPEAE